MIKLIFCFQCKFAIFSILQSENEVILRSRLLTFFWAAQQYDSYFFNDSAKDFPSVPAILKTSTIRFINGNFLKLLVLTQVSMGVIITSVRPPANEIVQKILPFYGQVWTVIA